MKLTDIALWIFGIGTVLFLLRRGIPGLIISQGYKHQDKGEYDAAENAFLLALAIEKKIHQFTGEKKGVAIIYSNLAILYHQWEHLDDAIKMFNSSIEIYADLGNPPSAAPVYASLGKVYFDAEDFTNAEKSLSEALSIYQLYGGSQEGIYTINALLEKISSLKK